MAPKRAIYLTYGNDEGCTQTRQFLEEAGVVLEIRDVEKDPLNAYELKGILGYLDAGHFINPSSESYAKNNLSEGCFNRTVVNRKFIDFCIKRFKIGVFTSVDGDNK